MLIGQRVFVYRNLTKKCYSIRAIDGPRKGIVIGHANFIQLKDCEFKVSEAGRQRVIKERRKNVHAGVIGNLISSINNNRGTGEITLQTGLIRTPGGSEIIPIPVLYNPYIHKKFQTGEGIEVNNAGMCNLHLTGITASQLS